MNISLPQPHAAVARAATCATLVAAFADDDAVRTVYPADADYFDHFPGLVAAIRRPGLRGRRRRPPSRRRRRRPLAAARHRARPGPHPRPPRSQRARPAAAPHSPPASRCRRALRPEAPHWSLPWIGVRPEAQGLGIGAALLRRGLARADAEGLPAYLEATTRRGASFFAAHGFAAIGIVIAAGYPQITAMWRPAGR